VALHLVLTFRRAMAGRRSAATAIASDASSGTRVDVGLVLATCAAVVFAGAMIVSLDLAFDSRLVPMLAAIPGLIAAVALVAMRLRGAGAVPWPSREEAKQIALLGAGIAAMPLAGFLPAVGAYLSVMLWTRSRMRLLILPYVAAIVASAYGLSKAFNIHLP
jgi:hypothetical protein